MNVMLAGSLLGLVVGVVCRWFDLPSPTPTGAAMVVAMTLGFVVAGQVSP